MTSTNRPAFTLIEILVALTIGVVLIVGLYWAVATQFYQAQASRDIIEESTLARQIFKNIQNDIERSLGPFDPSVLATPSSGKSTTPTTPSGTTPSSTTPSTSGTSSSGGTTGSSSSSSTLCTYNLGLQGSNEQLILFLSRAAPLQASDATTTPAVGDVRQVTYEIASETDMSGLVRRDVLLSQADDGTGDIIGSEVMQQPYQVLAAEAESLEFSYLDPVNGWVSDWPTGASAYDGVTQIGPPLAIEIRLTLRLKSGDTADFRHVVPIRSANGPSLKSLGQMPQGGAGP